jgi:hypothetical protein
MFTTRVIAWSFMTMFAVPLLSSVCAGIDVQHQGTGALLKALWAIGFGAAVYCIAAGLFLMVGWQDPLVAIAPEELARYSTMHRGKSSTIILAVRFWPYVLIGLGGYFSFASVANWGWWKPLQLA